MPSLNLRGVPIEFPFPPYDCQKDYMSKVLECLQNKQNGVLESPTGTGKTLCLLCSTLAWRDRFKDTISARKIAERLGGAELFPNTPMSSWGTTATDGDTPTYYTDVPKIIYASRTHSQLTQVINELKNTAYKPKVCVLGSREQLCINKDVMSQQSNHVKVHMCRAKIATRSCVYYNNVDEKSTDKDLANSILDVEDLVKEGTKQRVCPYYLSRSLKQQADIIFMPYNYLLDPKSRRAHNIELNGAVVIFDEAHNVEKMCEESTSFDLTPYDLASAIDAVDRLLMEEAKESCGGNDDLSFESSNSGLKLDVASIAKIKQILLDLEAAIDSYEVSADKGMTKPGRFIYDIFKEAQLTFTTKTRIAESLEQIIGSLTGRQGIFMNTNGLQKVADIIQLVFSGNPQEGDREAYMQSNCAQFKVHIHKEANFQKKKQPTDVWTSSSSKKQGNTLSYWCFSPGFSMKDLKQQGVRCVILTSGTLSPLSSFTAEMQIPFPVCLENPHVIQNDQIFVNIIDKGPDGVPLSSAFDRRFVPENMTSLGNTVANLGRVVPHGLLVFFPSYPVMEKTLEFWRANGQADRITNMKPMFVEPKGKGTFTEVIDGYYAQVDDPKGKGGSFFAVCRGKASEGLDFSDSYGRGVIITGLPFPPRMDPRVILKMQFLDEMRMKKVPGVKYLTGQEWYRQQASRAVNQAIGRVIRHKEDFGAIFLCDQRFKNADAKAQLPSWVRRHVRNFDNFGYVIRETAQFFRVAQKMRPPVEKKAVLASCATVSSPANMCSIPTMFLPSPSTRKAKVLDAHVPSIKRRKLSEVRGADGMARLCIEYETEMEASQRRPANLLDALEHNDQWKGDEDDSLVGEEKANRLSTMSLQYDKRIDDELRGGKRKIKLVQQRENTYLPEDVSDESKAGKAKRFLAEMKKSLSQVNFNRIMEALQMYKRTDDIEKLLLAASDIFTEDMNTHNLLRGFYQFIRPHHKKQFHEKCLELTGQGCGYKPEHSLSKDEKEALLQHNSSQDAPKESAGCGASHLNSALQLNKGGQHLHQAVSSKALFGQAQTGTLSVMQAAPMTQATPMVQGAPKKEAYAKFVADVKKALGMENSNQLFIAIKNYKDTDNYENLVATAVSLLTEKDEDFNLLAALGLVVRPHHRKQYNEMLDALIGDSVTTENREQQRQDLTPLTPPVRTQKKISSFFSNRQRK